MRSTVFIVILVVVALAVSCSNQEQTKAPAIPAQNTNAAAPPAQSPEQSTATSDVQTAKPKRPPATNITKADIAKLYWLEGAWRGGTGAPKPFFNKYAFYGTTLKISSFDDEAMTKQVEAARYELLKDGMFANPDGKDRFAASEITDSYIQFVALDDNKKGFRMERQEDGNLKATLEWTTADGKAEQRAYILEPLKK